MPWSFRNDISIPARNLTSEQELVHLADNVTLRPPWSDTGFTNADALLLEGENYKNSDQAYEEGKRWRQQLSVAFANDSIAVDFDTYSPKRSENQRPESPEAPGLVVFETPTGFSGFGQLRVKLLGSVTRRLDLFITSDLPAVQQLIPEGLTRRLELAYTTFHKALETSNPEVKYILFVTAIEALIDDDKQKSDDILRGVAALQKCLFDDSIDLSPSVKDALKRILNEAKKETIMQLGQQLAGKLQGTYGGRQPAAFFKHTYDGRSRILHGALKYSGNKKRPTIQQITQTASELHFFALDLLAAESAHTAT